MNELESKRTIFTLGRRINQPIDRMASTSMENASDVILKAIRSVERAEEEEGDFPEACGLVDGILALEETLREGKATVSELRPALDHLSEKLLLVRLEQERLGEKDGRLKAGILRRTRRLEELEKNRRSMSDYLNYFRRTNGMVEQCDLPDFSFYSGEDLLMYGKDLLEIRENFTKASQDEDPFLQAMELLKRRENFVLDQLLQLGHENG